LVFVARSFRRRREFHLHGKLQERTSVVITNNLNFAEWSGVFGNPKMTTVPPEICKVIYTTSAIESVNMSLRKITKNRGAFPSDEALLKLFYPALKNNGRKWTMPLLNWKSVLNRFTIQFKDRHELFPFCEPGGCIADSDRGGDQGRCVPGIPAGHFSGHGHIPYPRVPAA
jgi:hypothetical protein